MNHTFATPLLCAAIGLAGCGPTDPTSLPDPTDKRTSEHTSVKQVCLDGVSYYATWITDSIDSISRRSYLVVGGPVFAKGSSIPTSCETGTPARLPDR